MKKKIDGSGSLLLLSPGKLTCAFLILFIYNMRYKQSSRKINDNNKYVENVYVYIICVQQSSFLQYVSMQYF